MKVIDRPPNGTPYFKDRTMYGKKYNIEAVVVHWTGAPFRPSLNWLNRGKAPSTHYLVDKDGTVYRSVDEKHGAWCQGTAPHNKKGHWINTSVPNENLICVSIETVNNGREAWPEVQLEAMAELTADICKRNNLEISRHNIVAHNELSNVKSDVMRNPHWSWDDFLKRVEKYSKGTLDHYAEEHAKRLACKHNVGQLIQVCNRAGEAAFTESDWGLVKDIERGFHAGEF